MKSEWFPPIITVQGVYLLMPILLTSMLTTILCNLTYRCTDSHMYNLLNILSLFIFLTPVSFITPLYLCNMWIHTKPVLLMNLGHQNMLKAGHPLIACTSTSMSLFRKWNLNWFPPIISPQPAWHYFGNKIWIDFLLLFHLNWHELIWKWNLNWFPRVVPQVACHYSENKIWTDFLQLSYLN